MAPVTCMSQVQPPLVTCLGNQDGTQRWPQRHATLVLEINQTKHFIMCCCIHAFATTQHPSVSSITFWASSEIVVVDFLQSCRGCQVLPDARQLSDALVVSNKERVLQGTRRQPDCSEHIGGCACRWATLDKPFTTDAAAKAADMMLAGAAVRCHLSLGSTLEACISMPW
eukprot:GHUV01029257.1.p1 GENE.GHUV01029257.1~~GHUV01029257.1.p1  ORF type:complete len:170 (-),score=21.85 GHUV01029257.1:797-1306(-)